MKKTLLTGFAVCLACLLAGPGTAADYYDTQQTASPSDGPVILYGRVVDQHGSPVYKAQVTGGREYFSLGSVRFLGLETVQTETDAAGAFTFKGRRVKKLYITRIEKRGCEIRENRKGLKTFSYEEGGDEPPFRPDPARPVVFTVQKKFDAALVDDKKARILVRPDTEGFTADLFAGFSDALETITPEQAARDIIVRFVPLGPGQGRVMTITAPGAGNGLADNAGEPYVAPARLYGPVLAYPLPETGKARAVLYHRGRAGKVYSRLELELEPVESGLRVSAGMYTNLEGGRNTGFDSFYTEEQLVLRTGKKLSYGGSAYRQAARAILYNTIQ